MTVLPFTPRTNGNRVAIGSPVTAGTPVTGSFSAPSGRSGAFTGCYRLEQLLWQSGRLTAAGVYTGELTDSDGHRLGAGSRRLTAPVDVVAWDGRLVTRLAPQYVDLLGLLVAMPEFEVEVPAGSRRGASGNES